MVNYYWYSWQRRFTLWLVVWWTITDEVARDDLHCGWLYGELLLIKLTEPVYILVSYLVNYYWQSWQRRFTLWLVIWSTITDIVDRDGLHCGLLYGQLLLIKLTETVYIVDSYMVNYYWSSWQRRFTLWLVIWWTITDKFDRAGYHCGWLSGELLLI